tara:strand:- start:233 stop:382 length:150 start_codon:yes stop_codon:yes gene_type:complete
MKRVCFFITFLLSSFILVSGPTAVEKDEEKEISSQKRLTTETVAEVIQL